MREQHSATNTLFAIDSRPRWAAIEWQLTVALWLTLLALFVAISCWLFLRRLSGALVQPLGGWSIVGLAGATAVIAATLRWPMVAWRQSGVPGRVLSTQYVVPSAWVAFALPGVAAIGLLAALTIPGAPIWAIGCAGFLLIGSESASWLVTSRQITRRPVGLQPGPEHLAHPLAKGEGLDHEAETPAGLVQQVTRVREGEHESIHALIQATILAGDRLAVLHLAFCPPLEGPPELTAHALEAADMEVRITQAETFGTRIEVRSTAVAVAERAVVIEVLGKSLLGATLP